LKRFHSRKIKLITFCDIISIIFYHRLIFLRVFRNYKFNNTRMQIKLINLHLHFSYGWRRHLEMN